jgi:hypothetical protein
MPAGSTYTPIATITTSGSVSTYTFSSIPSTYTDIVAIGNFQLSTATAFRGRVNGDTGSNYSLTNLAGNGTSASSSRESNATNWVLGGVPTSASTAYDNTLVAHYMNYANTSTYKTVINRFGSASKETMANINLWRSTSAINSITLYVASGYIVDGSTFTLYGIAAA